METLQIIGAVILILFVVGLIVIIVQARNAHATTTALLELLQKQFEAKSTDKGWQDAVEAGLVGIVTPETRDAINKLVALVTALTPDNVDAFLNAFLKLFNQVTDGLPNAPTDAQLQRVVSGMVQAEMQRVNNAVTVDPGTTTTVTVTQTPESGKVG